MIKNIETQVLINMLDTRMNSCLCKMTRAIKEKTFGIIPDGSNRHNIVWDGGHFSFPTFVLMKELKAKLQKEEPEISVDENTFKLDELVQLIKACDHSEIRSHLVDCLICMTYSK